jgi:hypothetical protein
MPKLTLRRSRCSWRRVLRRTLTPEQGAPRTLPRRGATPRSASSSSTTLSSATLLQLRSGTPRPPLPLPPLPLLPRASRLPTPARRRLLPHPRRPQAAGVPSAPRRRALLPPTRQASRQARRSLLSWPGTRCPPSPGSAATPPAKPTWRRARLSRLHVTSRRTALPWLPQLPQRLSPRTPPPRRPLPPPRTPTPPPRPPSRPPPMLPLPSRRPRAPRPRRTTAWLLSLASRPQGRPRRLLPPPPPLLRQLATAPRRTTSPSLPLRRRRVGRVLPPPPRCPAVRPQLPLPRRHPQPLLDAPTAGKVHYAWFQVQDAIEGIEGIPAELKRSIIELVRKRWDYGYNCVIGAAYVMDPQFRTVPPDKETTESFNEFVAKRCPPPAPPGDDATSEEEEAYEEAVRQHNQLLIRIDQQLLAFRRGDGVFARAHVKEAALLMSGVDWWDLYGLFKLASTATRSMRRCARRRWWLAWALGRRRCGDAYLVVLSPAHAARGSAAPTAAVTRKLHGLLRSITAAAARRRPRRRAASRAPATPRLPPASRTPPRPPRPPPRAASGPRCPACAAAAARRVSAPAHAARPHHHGRGPRACAPPRQRRLRRRPSLRGRRR